jgi:hypothetical protein
MSFMQEGSSGLYQDFLELGNGTSHYKTPPYPPPLPMHVRECLDLITTSCEIIVLHNTK